MKKYKKTGIAALALMCMWGILYPELYLHPEVVRAVAQDGSTVCADSPSEYVRFLDAGSEEIIVRWKFVECMEQYFHSDEKGQEAVTEGTRNDCR